MSIPTFNGSPIPVIAFEPNDKEPRKLGKDYRTTVTESLDATEERQTRRPRALYRHEFTTVALNPAQLNHLRTVIETADELPVACPLWPVKTVLTATAASSATSLTLDDTAGCLFEVFPEYALLWSAWDNWEVVELDAVSDNGATLLAALANSYPVGAWLAPLAYGHVPRGPVNQLTDELGVWRCQFTETFHRLHDQSVPEDVVVDHGPPDPPSNMTLGNPSPEYLYWTWTPAEGSTYVETQRRIDGGDWESFSIVPAEDQADNDQPVAAGNYCYRIRSLGECGDPSAWLTEMCIDFDPDEGGPTLPQMDSVFLWLDAADASGPVSSWADQSGNGNHAAQSDSALQPTVATNEINSLPAVLFDAVNDRLELPDATWDLTAGLTIMAVFKSDSANGARQLFTLNEKFPAPNRWLRLAVQEADAGGDGSYDCTVGDVELVPDADLTGMADGSYNLVTVMHGDLDVRYFKNGTELERVSVTGGPGNVLRENNFIGTNDADGTINRLWLAELLVFRRYLSDSDREAWEDYLNTKYAL